MLAAPRGTPLDAQLEAVCRTTLWRNTFARVGEALPPLEQFVVRVALTPVEKFFYNDCLETVRRDARAFFASRDDSEEIDANSFLGKSIPVVVVVVALNCGGFNNYNNNNNEGFLALRQACNHPDLVASFKHQARGKQKKAAVIASSLQTKKSSLTHSLTGAFRFWFRNQ
jgi:SNF2 family DNA or RNA helicase